MFGRRMHRVEFERQVGIEIEILTKMHGEDAARVAGEKAVRPTNRTHRRKVLQEAARRLAGRAGSEAPPPSLMTRLFGS